MKKRFSRKYVLCVLLLAVFSIVLFRDFNRLYHRVGFFRESYNLSCYRPELLPTQMVIPFDSPYSQELTSSSEYKSDLFRLAPFFEHQENPFYCGVSVVSTILNFLRSLGKELPHPPPSYSEEFSNFRIYSQDSILNEETDSLIKPRSLINNLKESETLGRMDPGLALDELVKLFEYFGLKSTIHRAEEFSGETIAQFSQEVKAHVRSPDSFIVANFYRPSLGFMAEFGHYSIIAAYNSRAKTVLVLDSNLSCYNWFWVKVSDLYWAMHTKDGPRYRGYLVVEYKKK